MNQSPASSKASELLDLDDLEAAARAATPGPWVHRFDPGNPIGFQHGVKLTGEHGMWVGDFLDNADRKTEGACAGDRNAQFVAAANPAAVLELIALARKGIAAEAPDAEAAPVASAEPVAITKELRALIEWAYDQGARFGDEVPAEAWFYEAEESGSITKRWHTAAPVENVQPVGNCCYGGRKPKSACASCAAWEPVAQAAPAPADKPFPAPGAWFPIDILGNPMREHSPGKWENAVWPSATPEAAPVAPDALPPLPEPDGWIAVAAVRGELTSVAFRDEDTARAMCADGEPFPFWKGDRNAKTA